MTFLNSTQPIFRDKQQYLDVPDLEGLLKICWKVGDFTLFANSYTRVDQACLIWAVITFIIFAVAQFFPISWLTQAYWWSVLSIAGTLIMVLFTRYWVWLKGLTWLLFWWVFLMVLGIAVTNISIFWGLPWILPNLCHFWLILCVLGYVGTALGLASRAFFLIAIVHLVTIPLLSFIPQWQFLTTGSVMAGTLFLLAEVRWDMGLSLVTQVVTVSSQQNRKRCC